MRCLLAISLAALVVGCSACCHIDRLPDYARPIRTIEFTVEIRENPTLRFTRFEVLDSGILISPGPRQGHSENIFDDVLSSFGREQLASALLDELPPAFAELLHWHVAGENRAADAHLEIVVEEYSLTATEAQTATSLELLLRASLRDRSTGELIWRDCIQQSTALGGISVLELSHMSTARRREPVRQAAKDFAVWLAGSIARQ